MPTTYCCAIMERWSKPQEATPPLIHRTKVGTIVGIRCNDGGKAIVSIAVCPWCGSPVGMGVEKSLIGIRMVEVR